MTDYQRKSLQLLIAINVITGLYQYLNNGAVVFSTQINNLFFLVLSFYLGIRAFLHATIPGRIMLVVMIIAASVRFLTDPFTMELLFTGQHEYAMELMNSSFWAILQGTTALLLILTLLLMAYMEKKRSLQFTGTLIVFAIALLSLAFFDLPIEPLVVLIGLALFLGYYLLRFKESLPQGLSSSMVLWIAFVILEATNFWNLHL